MEDYRVVLYWEDSEGWKWGQSVPLWGGTLAGALEAGRLTMEWHNAKGGDKKVTGYHAYKMEGVRS